MMVRFVPRVAILGLNIVNGTKSVAGGGGLTCHKVDLARGCKLGLRDVVVRNNGAVVAMKRVERIVHVLLLPCSQAPVFTRRAYRSGAYSTSRSLADILKALHVLFVVAAAR